MNWIPRSLVFQKRGNEEMSLIGSTCVDRCDQHEVGYIEHQELGPNALFAYA